MKLTSELESIKAANKKNNTLHFKHLCNNVVLHSFIPNENIKKIDIETIILTR